ARSGHGTVSRPGGRDRRRHGGKHPVYPGAAAITAASQRRTTQRDQRQGRARMNQEAAMKALSIPMSRSITAAIARLLLATPVLAQFGSAPTVEIVPAELREMAPTMQIAGTVLSRSDAVLSAEIEGRLVEVADVGTRV